MVVGISGKKEMGIVVQAITQYADDCMGNGDYIEMVNALKIALNMANMYFIKHFYKHYIAEVKDDLQETIHQGEYAQQYLDLLEEII